MGKIEITTEGQSWEREIYMGYFTSCAKTLSNLLLLPTWPRRLTIFLKVLPLFTKVFK